MSVLQIQRIHVCALKTDRKVILERLQAMGVVEIDIRLDDRSKYKTPDVSQKRFECERMARTAEHALDVLQHYVPEKKGMLDSLAGKPLVEKDVFNETVREQEEHIKKAEAIIQLDKQISECRAHIQNLRNQIDVLAPWMELCIPLGFEGTKKTSVFIGTLAGNVSREEIIEMLSKDRMEEAAAEVQILSKDKDFTYIVVVCLKQDAVLVEESLRMDGFARPSQVFEGIPAEAKRDFEKDIQVSEQQMAQLKVQLNAYEIHRNKIQMVSDHCRLQAERYETLGQLPETEMTFAFSGYIPMKDGPKVADELSQNYGAVVEFEDAPEDAPVILKNNKFAEIGEGVVASFGLPAKGEIDPTAIMTAFYVFLFGLMLADIAYGLIVAVFCGIAVRKYPRMEENLRKTLRLFFWCGVSTLFWGIMFGGLFGDAVSIISNHFFGKDISMPAVWFVPLEEPMRMLLWSILFGLIHMYTGLVLKAWICIKNRRYMDAVWDVGLWFLLVTGLILLLIPSDIFSSMFQIKVMFPEGVNLLAKAMTIAGTVGIVLMSGRQQKNKWGVRIAMGAYDLYNITGWLSDALSYSRLLALGLASGVIASVFNQMGSMFGNGIIGTIIFVVVFIVGHIFNLALNLLGTYVHTCRLQYIEFFGKFYEGGGRPFRPFCSNTKYVDIKEEVK